jgi:hypothetical protein
MQNAENEEQELMSSGTVTRAPYPQCAGSGSFYLNLHVPKLPVSRKDLSTGDQALNSPACGRIGG